MAKYNVRDLTNKELEGIQLRGGCGSTMGLAEITVGKYRVDIQDVNAYRTSNDLVGDDEIVLDEVPPGYALIGAAARVHTASGTASSTASVNYGTAAVLSAIDTNSTSSPKGTTLDDFMHQINDTAANEEVKLVLSNHAPGNLDIEVTCIFLRIAI